MYTPQNRDVEALGAYVPLVPASGEDAACDGWRGRYLCEGCQDVMTDDVLAASACVWGVEMACCRSCQVRLRRGA
jgi:hypothetical protein